MLVYLVDPSLFTLPYDRMLAKGLGEAGHRVVLHGRRPTAEDGEASGIDLQPSFYPLAGSRMAAALPRPARLALKGIDHGVSMLRLRNRLARERPDVIHFQWLPLPVVDRPLLAGFRSIAPLILTVHDSNPFNGDASAGLQRMGNTSALAAFDRLIVHTDQGRARLIEQGVPAERIVRVPHGLLGDAPAAPVGAPASNFDGELNFLIFGKIKPYKGIDLLIEAFSRLPADLRAQARIRVVGKPYMDVGPLEALADVRGVADRFSLETRFVADEEIPALFGAQGTIAAFPYREIEASGVMALAIASGNPILAARLGGFAETIEDGRHGLLVPAEDISALAASMEKMIRDRAFTARCASSVRALAGEVPTWGDIGHRTTQVYDEARGEWCAERGRLPEAA